MKKEGKIDSSIEISLKGINYLVKVINKVQKSI